MKSTVAFIHKEFLHILRDKRTLLIVFAMPIVLVLLFGFAITTDVKDAKIAVLDNAKDDLSIGLLNKLTSSGYFQTERYLNTNADVQSVFGDGKVKLVIVIPANFSEAYHHDGVAKVQLIADATDPNAAAAITAYANAIIHDYQTEISGAPQRGALFDVIVKMYYNPELKSVYMYVPGVLALILAIISAMMTAISLTKEKEFGSFRTLSVSPLKIKTIVIGKVIPYLLISLIDTFIVLILSRFVFDMPINGSLVLLFVVCILFLFTSMSMGVLIASLVNSQQVAAIISIVGLFLPTTLLSGFIYPIENMPIILQALCQVFPAKWFIVAIKSVMIKGVGLQYIWIELLVMMAMALIFLTIGIKKFSKQFA